MTTHSTTWRDWVAVATLGIGCFAIVTTELAPIGLLSQIGSDLDTSPAQVGQVVTLYAWVAVAAALFSATVLSRVPRRPLLIALMLVLAASSGVAALAEQFPTLMGARVIGAFAHGAFWAMIGTLGAQIVPPHRVGLATSVIFGGVSAASVLGVPLANLVGTAAGWRTAFACIAILSFLVAVAISLALPRLPGVERVGVSDLARVLSNPRFRRVFAATLLAITAHFMAFTYVEPFLTAESGMPVRVVAPLLFGFGAAGLAGNVLTGVLVDTRLKSILVVSLIVSSGMLLALATMPEALGLAGTALVLVLWGAAIAAILVCFQTWILKEAGRDALPASAIYVAIFNGAIGLGAMIGSLVLSFSGLLQIFLLASLSTAGAILAIAVLNAPAPASAPAE